MPTASPPPQLLPTSRVWAEGPAAFLPNPDLHRRSAPARDRKSVVRRWSEHPVVDGRSRRRRHTRPTRDWSSDVCSSDLDPDLAGMQPGPQRKPDWLEDFEDGCLLLPLLLNFFQPVGFGLRARLHSCQIRIFIAGARRRVRLAFARFHPALFLLFFPFRLSFLACSFV